MPECRLTSESKLSPWRHAGNRTFSLAIVQEVVTAKHARNMKCVILGCVARLTIEESRDAEDTDRIVTRCRLFSTCLQCNIAASVRWNFEA